MSTKWKYENSILPLGSEVTEKKKHEAMFGREVNQT